MRIGVINMPGRNKYRGQSIQTRFFILGLPLFPTGCVYKVTESLGIDIPITGKDIFHAYAKIHFGLVGLGLFIWGINMGKYDSATLKTVVLMLSLVLLGLSIYSWLMHYNIKGTEEEFKRRVLGRAFLYHMPPEYLPVKVQKSLFAELLKIYMGKYGKLDWQATIKAEEVTKENLPILYSLALYQQTLEPTQENKYLTADLWDYLNDRKELKIHNNSEKTATTSSSMTNFSAKENTPSNTQVEEAMADRLKNFKAAQEKTKQESTTQQSATSPESAAKFDHIMKLVNEIQETQGKEKSAQFKTTTNPNAKMNFSGSTNIETVSKEMPLGTPIKMTLTDVAKISEAKSTMVKQALMIFAFFPIAVIVAGIIGIGGGFLVEITIITLLLLLVITGIVFFPDYMKLQKDLNFRQKIRIKVRIQDLAAESGTTYLVLKPNKYGISKLTAPSNYYSTSLLNKELEIFVSKEGHTLLEIIGASY